MLEKSDKTDSLTLDIEACSIAFSEMRLLHRASIFHITLRLMLTAFRVDSVKILELSHIWLGTAQFTDFLQECTDLETLVMGDVVTEAQGNPWGIVLSKVEAIPQLSNVYLRGLQKFCRNDLRGIYSTMCFAANDDHQQAFTAARVERKDDLPLLHKRLKQGRTYKSGSDQSLVEWTPSSSISR